MGKHNKGGGKSWVRGGWQQGNRGSGGGGGGGRGKPGRYGGGGGGGGAGYGISPTPTARAYGLQQQARRGGGGDGGGWAGSSKRGGGFPPTSHAAREAFYSQKQGSPRWHQEAGLPPISDSLHQQQQQQQQRSNGDDHYYNSRNSNSGGGGRHTARDLLSPAFSQNSSRRRIEFHKATKPSTIFSPSGGPTTTTAAARNVDTNNRAGGQKPRTNGGEGAGSREGVAGGVDDLARIAEKKIGLPPPGKELYLDSKIKACLRWKQVHRMGPGLRNLGNTCFLNATLQCLSYLPPLAQHLLNGFYGQGPQGIASRGPRPMGGFREFTKVEILAAMEQHTKQVHQGQFTGLGAISPKVLVQNLRMIGRQFRQGRQEDAHEFLRHLLDKMVDCYLKRKGVKSSAPNRLAETTPINRIFGGYLRSRLKCTKCGHCSDTFDPFMDLSMDLSRGVRSIDVALKRFVATERLGSGNEWRCGGCKKPVQAEKSLSVFKPPNALVLQLKRFVFTRKASKIKDHIQFADVLNLSVSGPERSALYDLTGVVVHAGGSMSSGHYYAYVRSCAGMWARMDDCSVSKVKRETVLRDQAYVLFYTRRPAPKTVVASIPPAPSLSPSVKVSSTASAAAVGKPAATASAAVPETKRKKLVPAPEGKGLVGVSPRQGEERCNGNRGGTSAVPATAAESGGGPIKSPPPPAVPPSTPLPPAVKAIASTTTTTTPATTTTTTPVTPAGVPPPATAGAATRATTSSLENGEPAAASSAPVEAATSGGGKAMAVAAAGAGNGGGVVAPSPPVVVVGPAAAAASSTESKGSRKRRRKREMVEAAAAAAAASAAAAGSGQLGDGGGSGGSVDKDGDESRDVESCSKRQKKQDGRSQEEGQGGAANDGAGSSRDHGANGVSVLEEGEGHHHHHAANGTPSGEHRVAAAQQGGGHQENGVVASDSTKELENGSCSGKDKRGEERLNAGAEEAHENDAAGAAAGEVETPGGSSKKKRRKKKKRKKQGQDQQAGGGEGGVVGGGEPAADPAIAAGKRSHEEATAGVDFDAAAMSNKKHKSGEGTGGEGESRSASAISGAGLESSESATEGSAAAAADATAPAAVGDANGGGDVGGNGAEAGATAPSVSVSGKDELGAPADAAAPHAMPEVTGNKVTVPWRPAKRKSQDLFGEKVGFWGDATGDEEGGGEGEGGDTALDKEALHRLASAKELQSGLSRKQAAEEHKDKMSRASSFWDRSLDMGKVKKVKEKKDPQEMSASSSGDAFQAKQEQMHGQSKRRGHREEKDTPRGNHANGERGGRGRRGRGGGRGMRGGGGNRGGGKRW